MLLRKLLESINHPPLPKFFEKFEVDSICSDSRRVQEGSLFVAVPGAGGHGDQFITDAVSRGAKVIIAAHSAKIPAANTDVLILNVDDPQRVLLKVLLRFYDNPSGKLGAIGITGTNGKTTITYLLESIFQSAGKSCGVVGTVNHRYGKNIFPSLNTTPGIIENQKFLSDMVQAKADYCVMEVSSHALVQGRVDGINFRQAIFTNLTSDHLDYHKDREDYFLAKSRLFTALSKDATAVINMDDEYGRRLVEMTKSRVCTYGIQNMADIRAVDIKLTLRGSQFIVTSGKEKLNVKTSLIGLHNIYNILAAIGVGQAEGIPLAKIRDGIDQLKDVPGRLEQISSGQDFHVFVDYAHTEDALKNVLTSLRQVSGKRIIVVFGCGGDRDKSKRPKMGQVVSDLADEAIITNDNPRSEDPETIAAEIMAGFKGNHFRKILNREDAIRAALTSAKAGDVVLIAGKGHEDYQIFKDKKIPFKEHDVIRKHLKEIKTPQNV